MDKINQKPSRIQLKEIIIFKTLCIMAVLVVHATSDAIVSYNMQYSGYAIFNFFNRFFAYGTPLFIMISGFLYFYAYWNRSFSEVNWERYWLKRLAYIIIPYIFFSLLYYAIKKFWLNPIDDADWADHFKMIWDYLHNGRSHPHLYFFIVMIQLYIVFPVLLYLMKKKTWLFTYAPIFGIAIHIGFLILNNRVDFVDQKGSLLISYFSFYTLGIWLGGNYEKFKAHFHKPFRSLQDVAIALSCLLLAFGVGLMFVESWYGVRTSAFKVHSLTIEFSYVFYILPLAMILLYLSNWIAKWNDTYMKQFLLNIGIRSFGIYLIHPLFLMFYRLYVPSGMNADTSAELAGQMNTSFRMYVLWIVGSYLVALIGSYFVVGWIIKWVPFYQYIIGNVQKK
jgi:surface polysaccharide O-acyltransferase-like enzyme